MKKSLKREKSKKSIMTDADFWVNTILMPCQMTTPCVYFSLKAVAFCGSMSLLR